MENAVEESFSEKCEVQQTVADNSMEEIIIKEEQLLDDLVSK